MRSEALADDGVVVRCRREGRLVDLDVARAGLDEGLYLLVDQVGQVVSQCRLVLVDLVERPVGPAYRGP